MPKPGDLMANPAASSWKIAGAYDTVKTIDADIAGGKAVRVSVKTPTKDPWGVVAQVPLNDAVLTGETLLIAFWARAEEAINEAQSGVISTIRIEEGQEPYGSAAEGAALLSGEWTLVLTKGTSDLDIPKGIAQLTVHLGAARQKIDLGPVMIFNLGKGVSTKDLPVTRLTYLGGEDDAPWRAEAAARIEKHRKGPLSIRVQKQDGTPVEGATIDVEMVKHGFKWGTFIGHQFVSRNDADGKKVRETFEENFNYATAPLYWQDWGWQNPEWRANYIATMKYLQDNGITWRGHPITWPVEAQVPTYIKSLAGNKDKVTAAIMAHIADVIPTAMPFGPDAFDVINETRDGTYLPSIAADGLFVDTVKQAKKFSGDVPLYINEYGIINNGGTNSASVDFYKSVISQMIKQGAAFDGIGIQGHFGAGLTNPARVYEILDEFAAFGVPLQITEFDVDTEDEIAQANYTRDIMTIAFSHPAMDAFIVWGWWEGDHWKPNAAMMRKDWSSKPNHDAWRDLVFNQWWTDETLESDAKGEARLSAFLGDYKVTVKHKGKTITQTQALVDAQDGKSLVFTITD